MDPDQSSLRFYKIKNEQPHAGGMSIRDVILMFKLHHHVASQRFQDFLEQGSYASGKCQGNLNFFKVRELSGNFMLCQGKMNVF